MSFNSGSNKTDFSIERILSDNGSSSEKPTESLSWLKCTRYEPPIVARLPSSKRRTEGRRAGNHARIPFTTSQSNALECAFTQSNYLAPAALRVLASTLQLREDRIKIWFQNRRARERRERNTKSRPEETNLAIQENIIKNNYDHQQTSNDCEVEDIDVESLSEDENSG